ncbi:hypothetical protein [Streptomyces cavernae]|uniref:hypothetical protein n=1 Tax=Streptomyces cavernae TaxID=2259034 RepID=UPI000FEB680F|nr:hypothetical protein [Streptomyces cavernae]
MLNATWIRLASGQLVRADRIVGVRPERAEAPEGRWAGPSNVRIMVCLDVPEADAEEDTGAWWQEAAVCAQDRGDLLVVNLLNLMADATAGSGLRFIYPVVRAGQFERWASGSVLPPAEEPAVTGLPRIPRGVAARA